MTWEVLIPKKLLKEKETIQGFWSLAQEAENFVLKILTAMTSEN